MPLPPAISDIEQLKDHAEVSTLLNWRRDAVQGAKFDRGQLAIYIEASAIADACRVLRDSAATQYDYFCDVTCVDWHPSEPRFEVVYHLFSIPRKTRIRLKVKLPGEDPRLPSVTPVWPAANFFEREVFDLFGVHFEGHPFLRRILMPDTWEGHPLRKDYPVEGYR